MVLSQQPHILKWWFQVRQKDLALIFEKIKKKKKFPQFLWFSIGIEDDLVTFPAKKSFQAGFLMKIATESEVWDLAPQKRFETFLRQFPRGPPRLSCVWSPQKILESLHTMRTL